VRSPAPAVRNACPRGARSGGRGAGTAYAPSAPAEAGGGNTWPFRVVVDVEPHALRETYDALDAHDRAADGQRRGGRMTDTQRATTRRQSIRSVSETTIPSGPRTCAMRQVFSC
jgi:hypothetical protein